MAGRLADDRDPLRRILRAARSWRVAPTIFMGRVRPSGADWLPEDTELAMALEDYEAGLCPGCQHPLSETSRIDHDGAYVPDEPTLCHHCDAQALNAEVVSKRAERTGQRTEGLLFSFSLDPERVALNQKPVPPLPPELQRGVNGQ